MLVGLHDVAVAPLVAAGHDSLGRNYEGFVIVKVAAVAINPVDPKILDPSPAVGDRVANTVHGNNSSSPNVGAFAEYVAAEGDLMLRMPDTMSFEDGATIVTGLLYMPTLEEPLTRETTQTEADF
ncbi:GroES-like protein [Apiospora saccharicola]|uniref:GroES-like protein n=1 Tax=Apiospora saccharicola TaxID=335842 RepID=A0ABR1U688_9PEZI